MGAGPEFEARRAYLWSFEGTGVVVRFDDETPFHSFTAIGQSDGTVHHCGADTYRVRYDFSHWPRWQATWRVTGPRKDYLSVSDYSRDS
jgi:hypothetical protein